MRVILSATAALLLGAAAPIPAGEPMMPLEAQRVYGAYGAYHRGGIGGVPGYGFRFPAAVQPAAFPPVAVFASPAWTFRNPLYSGLAYPPPYPPYSAAYPPRVGSYPAYFRSYRPAWAIPLHRPWGYGYRFGYGLGWPPPGFGGIYGLGGGIYGPFGPYGIGMPVPPPLAAPQFSVLGAYGLPYGCAW